MDIRQMLLESTGYDIRSKKNFNYIKRVKIIKGFSLPFQTWMNSKPLGKNYKQNNKQFNKRN